MEQDPLTLSISLCRVWKSLKDCLSFSTRQSAQPEGIFVYNLLTQHYGQRIYKCDRPACDYFRIGFQSSTDQALHIRAHNKVFRCYQEGCKSFATTFTSQNLLDQHVSETQSEFKQGLYLVSDQNTVTARVYYSQEDLRSIILDAIDIGQLDYANRLLLEVKLVETPKTWRHQLLSKAISKSSILIVMAMVEQIGAQSELDSFGRNILEEICDQKSFQLLKYVLEYKTGVQCLGYCFEEIVVLALKNAWPEGVRLATEFLSIHKVVPISHVQGGVISQYWNSRLADEEHIIMYLRILIKRARPILDKPGFLMSMATYCYFSTKVAQFLIDKGADINFANSSGQFTVLSRTLERQSLGAAKFTRFLLEAGARVKPQQKWGLHKHIEKHLGVTWKQLLEDTEHFRRSTPGPTPISTKSPSNPRVVNNLDFGTIRSAPRSTTLSGTENIPLSSVSSSIRTIRYDVV